MIAVVTWRANTRNRGNDSCSGRHFAHPVVNLVCDIQIAYQVHGYGAWEMECGAGGNSIVAAEACRAIASHRCDHSSGLGDFANPIARCVSDIDIAAHIDGHAGWSECGVSRHNVVTVAHQSVAGNGSNDSSGGRYFANSWIAYFGDIQVTR